MVYFAAFSYYIIYTLLSWNKLGSTDLTEEDSIIEKQKREIEALQHTLELKDGRIHELEQQIDKKEESEDDSFTAT